MSEGNRYIDHSGDRKYFTQIPNLIIDFPLSPYAFRVYVHIKRVTGEDGICWQTTRTIADRCNISRNSVNRAIKELVSNRFIEVIKVPGKHGEFSHNEMTIRDIWKNNVDFYNLTENQRRELISQWKTLTHFE